MLALQGFDAACYLSSKKQPDMLDHLSHLPDAFQVNKVFMGQVAGFLEEWVTGSSTVTYSPGGLAVISVWGSLRYAASASFVGLVYAKNVAGAHN